MDTSNHEHVGKALHLLREGLGPFVEREVKTALDSGRISTEALIEKWWNNAPHAHSLRNKLITDLDVASLDVAGLLRLMRITWRDVSYSILGRTELNLVHDLSTYRNKWAHQEELSSEDVYRVLDSSERLLRAISATKEAEIVMQSRLKQLQALVENNQIENNQQDKNYSSKHHIEGDQILSAQVSGSARGVFLQSIHKAKENHKGKPEELTRKIAKIILKECLDLCDKQIIDEFRCTYGPLDKRNGWVDIAATYENNNSKPVEKYPKILLELKKSDRKFVFGTEDYFEDIDQLKKYMNSKECESVEHGIIFNIGQLQIFRKHNKLIYPVTKVIDFLPGNITDFIKNNSSQRENIHKIVNFVKTVIIRQPQESQKLPATIIAIYNNKGGVGKTTTVSYLSYFLRKKSGHLKERMNSVLMIDYDHNQANLTKRFGFDKTDGEMHELLVDVKKGKDVSQFQLKYIKQVRFKEKGIVIDFLAADQVLCEGIGTYEDVFNFEDNNCLKKLCLELGKKYDYIIIDTSPGWEQSPHTQAAVTAADCLLPLSKWGDFDSFDGYRSVICDKLPKVSQVQSHMKPDKPDNLGLWITDSRDNDPMIKDMIINEFEYHISQIRNKKQELELRRGFFDFQNGNKLRTIKHSALILKSSCHNPELRKDFLKTCHYTAIDKAYKKLLNSFIGD